MPNITDTRHDTRARRRLLEWTGKDPKSRSKAAIGRVLHVKPPSVIGWLTGASRPESHLREAIETMTGGFVRARDWVTPDERESVAGVVPMVRSRTAKG